MKEKEKLPDMIPFAGIDQDNLVDLEDLSSVFGVTRSNTAYLDGLNEEQKDMVNGIIEYVKTNKDGKEYFLIQGGGGVGKSYAIGRALHELFGYAVVAAAPSHFAKNILKDFLEEHSVEVYTVATLMGKKLTFNRDGEMVLVDSGSKRKPPLTYADIIIIDEVSMIDDATVQELLEKCKFKKLIFLGDYCQLPPVGQSTDNVAFKNIHAELTEPMRFKGYIYELANAVRSEINKARAGRYAELKVVTMFTRRQSKIAEDGTGYIFLDNFNPFIKAAIKRFKEGKGTQYVRVLAYRNNSIDRLNAIIRKSLYGVKAIQFEVGELIINNGGYKQDITNGQVLVVKSVRNIVGKFGVPCVELRFENDSAVVPVVSIEGKKDYSYYENDLLSIAKKNSSKWEEFYAFKDSFAYFNYSYATSIHKAQGSSISNIFIYEDDIMSIKPIGVKEKLQSLYVAITRASFRVFIFNKDLKADQKLLIKEYLLIREEDGKEGKV